VISLFRRVAKRGEKRKRGESFGELLRSLAGALHTALPQPLI